MKRVGVVVFSVLVLAGCGSGTSAKSVTSTSTASTTESPGVTTSAPTTTLAVAPGTISLTSKDAGTTIRVAKGATIAVTLNSTYWKFPTLTDAAVLQQVGGIVTTPSPVGSCVPGGGCGTVSATYKTVGVGQTKISASRTTCGEALACTGNSGSYSVQVVVTGA